LHSMIFPPLGGFFMGETLSCDTGMNDF